MKTNRSNSFLLLLLLTTAAAAETPAEQLKQKALQAQRDLFALKQHVTGEVQVFDATGVNPGNEAARKPISTQNFDLQQDDLRVELRSAEGTLGQICAFHKKIWQIYMPSLERLELKHPSGLPSCLPWDPRSLGLQDSRTTLDSELSQGDLSIELDELETGEGRFALATRQQIGEEFVIRRVYSFDGKNRFLLSNVAHYVNDKLNSECKVDYKRMPGANALFPHLATLTFYNVNAGKREPTQVIQMEVQNLRQSDMLVPSDHFSPIEVPAGTDVYDLTQ